MIRQLVTFCNHPSNCLLLNFSFETLNKKCHFSALFRKSIQKTFCFETRSRVEATYS